MSPKKAEEIIAKIMIFLRIFMCDTLVKRIMSMLLLSIGVEKSRVTELTGLCARSVHSLKKAMENGDIESQFKIETGRKGKRKMQDIEAAIIEEVEKNDYHSQQQIADMVEEKYGLKVSARTVGRLLKKTKLNG
jgi:transposase